jgi:hypothetical protein
MDAQPVRSRHLRQLVTECYSVEATIAMHDVDAFDEPVSAYPAITIIKQAKQAGAIVADTAGTFEAADAAAVVA